MTLLFKAVNGTWSFGNNTIKIEVPFSVNPSIHIKVCNQLLTVTKINNLYRFLKLLIIVHH